MDGLADVCPDEAFDGPLPEGVVFLDVLSERRSVLQHLTELVSSVVEVCFGWG
jgi:hypothetical protein